MAKKVSVKEKVDKAKKDLVSEATPEASQNVTKLEQDMEFSVKNLRDKINEAKTIGDLDATQDYFEMIYGVNAEIPADLQKLYDEKLAQLKSQRLALSSAEPGWIPMTREEAKQYEVSGKLCGYDAERGVGLIN
jgi:hypothetical protein